MKPLRIFPPCLALLLLAASAAAEETYTLRLNFQTGEVWNISQSMQMQSSMKQTFGEQTQQMDSKMEQLRIGKMEVLEVDANGMPTAMRLTYDPKCKSSMEMTGQPAMNPPFPFAGKTITVRRQPDGSITHDFKEQVDPQVMQMVEMELRSMFEPDTSIYPKKPVAVGEEWAGDSAIISKMFQLQGDDRAGSTMKLLSIKQLNGRQAAEVKVSTAAFKTTQGVKSKSIMQGTMLLDLRSGRPMKVDLKGTMEQNGDGAAPGGGTFHVEGTGSTEITATADPVGGGTVTPATQSGALAGILGVNTPATRQAPPVNPVNPVRAAPFAGKFADAKLTVQLESAGEDKYSGTITLGDHKFPATAAVKNGKLTGTFADAAGNKFAFTASLDGGTLTLETGTSKYTLKKQSANPLDPQSQSSPRAPSQPGAAPPGTQAVEIPTITPPPAAPGGGVAHEMLLAPFILQDDPRAIGGEVCRFLVPADWKVEGTMEWDLRRIFNPAGARITAASPDGRQSIATFPKLIFCWGTSPLGLIGFPRGSLYLGQEVQPPPGDGVKAITEFVAPRYLPRLLKGARVVQTQELPKLAEAMLKLAGQMPPGVTATAKAARVRFEGGGLPAGRQADVYAVVGYLPMPALASIDWGIDQIVIVQGSADELESLFATYEVMAASTQLDLKWFNIYAQVCDGLQQIEKNASDAAVVRSRIIAAAQRDISDTIRQRYESRQATLDHTSQNWSEMMRGVERWSIPGERRPVELPTGYQYAWRSGDGRYFVTDDGSADPNRGGTSSWTRLSRAR